MKIKQRGFTLLELLVVLLIIGMLVAYVGPKYFGEVGKSQTQVAAAQIEAIGQALDQFRVDTGHYPTATEGLASLYSPPSGSGTAAASSTSSSAATGSTEPNWNGPYLKKPVPPDPWGNAYNYVIPSKVVGKDYDLTSNGPTDGNAPISN
jgi:general secretion pathway protein G